MSSPQQIPWRVKILGLTWVAKQLAEITLKLQKIMSTQKDIIAEQQAQLQTIGKINAETRTLVDQVKKLVEQINAGEVSQELADATAAVSAQLKIVDDLVPDAPEQPQGGGE